MLYAAAVDEVLNDGEDIFDGEAIISKIRGRSYNSQLLTQDASRTKLNDQYTWELQTKLNDQYTWELQTKLNDQYTRELYQSKECKVLKTLVQRLAAQTSQIAVRLSKVQTALIIPHSEESKTMKQPIHSQPQTGYIIHFYRLCVQMSAGDIEHLTVGRL